MGRLKNQYPEVQKYPHLNCAVYICLDVDAPSVHVQNAAKRYGTFKRRMNTP